MKAGNDAAPFATAARVQLRRSTKMKRNAHNASMKTALRTRRPPRRRRRYCGTRAEASCRDSRRRLHP
eukprot:1071097-Pleurochrysis_carterae.AAC.3